MSVKNRLKEYIKSKKITIKAFEESINASNGYVNSISKGVGKEYLEVIREKYPDLDLNWLLNLDKIEEIERINSNSNIKTNNITDVAVVNNIEVPYYDVDFSGGWQSENLFTTHRPSFFITNPEFDKAEFACNLIGNSISRVIPNGAIIGLKEIKDWEIYFPGNEVYAVVMKNKLRTVKIIKKSSDKKHLILIPSPLDEHNKTGYEPEEVPIDFVDKFFQVVAWGQFEKLAQ